MDQFNNQPNDQFSNPANNPYNQQPNDQFNNPATPQYTGQPTDQFPQQPNPQYTGQPSPQFNNQPNYQYNNPMGNPGFNQMNYPAMPAKRISGATIAMMIAAAVATLISAVMWFLPVWSGAETMNMLQVLQYGQVDLELEEGAEAMSIFWSSLIIYFLTVVWTAIPQKWAGIVGVVFTPISLGVTINFLSAVNAGAQASRGAVSVSAFPYISLVFSFLALGFAVAKLILMGRDNKRSAANNSFGMYGGQPPYMPR